MTTTPTMPVGVTFGQAVELLAAHLTAHELPQPASLTVTTTARQPEVTAQVPSNTVAKVAADLLAWAHTLTTVTVQAWRPPSGDQVHVSIASTLTGPVGTVDLEVYGGAEDDPALFADLAPGQHNDVPLGHLRTWAARSTDTPGGGPAA